MGRLPLEFPVYLRLGSVRLHPHLVFETLAYAIGFQAYARLRKYHGDPISDNARWWVIAAAAAGAALGSKVLYWFEDPSATLNNWTDPHYLVAGRTIVGGLLGGLIAVEWIKKRLGVTRSTGDLFAIPLALGTAVGRIGCFLTGLSDNTYGVPTSLPWGINFGDGVRRHPTQIYEVIFLLLLSFFLWKFMRIPHHNGDVFKVFMVSYMGWRLLADFLKPEIRIGVFSGTQWACVLTLFYYLPDIARMVTVALGASEPSAPEL